MPNRLWNRLNRSAIHHGLAYLLILGVVLGTVWLSGNITGTPRMVDENQIFFLHGEIADHGLIEATTDHFLDRTFRMGRFLPVFIVHKMAEVWAFGTNIVAWSLYTAFLASLSALVLYAFGRLIQFTFWEALFFALIAVTGHQSVLWWRLFHGEGIGLLFTGLALISAARAAQCPPHAGRWTGAFLGATVAASLSKESFILAMPALALAFLWLHRNYRQVGWLTALRQNVAPVAILAGVCLAEVLGIKYGLQRTDFQYTGWRGYDHQQFLNILGQFFARERTWILYVTGLIVGLLPLFVWLSGKPVSPLRRLVPELVALLVLVGMVLLPQFLLYMSSGFHGGDADYSRFLIPSTLAFAGLVICPIALARSQIRRAGRPSRRAFRLAIRALCIPVLTFYIIAQLQIALAHGRDYGDEVDELGAFYRVISENSSPDDTVVVLVVEDHGYLVRRLLLVLDGYLSRSQIQVLPCRLTDEAPDAPFRFGWDGENDLTRAAEHHVLDSLADHSRPPMLVIPSCGGVVKQYLRKHEPQLFDRDQYTLFQNRMNDTVFVPVR